MPNWSSAGEAVPEGIEGGPEPVRVLASIFRWAGVAVSLLIGVAAIAGWGWSLFGSPTVRHVSATSQWGVSLRRGYVEAGLRGVGVVNLSATAPMTAWWRKVGPSEGPPRPADAHSPEDEWMLGDVGVWREHDLMGTKWHLVLPLWVIVVVSGVGPFLAAPRFVGWWRRRRRQRNRARTAPGGFSVVPAGDAPGAAA